MPKYGDLTPRRISRMTESEARAAYSQLRRTVNKRLQRLESAGYERDIKSGSFRPVSELDRDEVKTQLGELSRVSRMQWYSLSEMDKRTRGLQKWMAKRGFKDTSFKAAKAFGAFMGKLNDAGAGRESAPRRYATELDQAVSGFNSANLIEQVVGAFDEYMVLKDAGVNMDELFQNGTIFGMDLPTINRHRVSINRHLEELEAISNDPDFERPRTEKDVNNLLRRARRMRARRA